MTEVVMRIYNPKRETRPYVVPTVAGPVIKGTGDTTFVCGKCSARLLDTVYWNEVKDFAVQCRKCTSVNAVPEHPVGALSKISPSDSPTPPVGTIPDPQLAPSLRSDGTRKRISVCTPCYNEEENVYDVYNAVNDLFEIGGPLANYEREHIFADNDSTDRTAHLLREIAAKDPCVKVIINARNFGGARSGYNAIISASGDATLMFLPADQQDPSSLLPLFVKLWEQGNEIVYGVRATRSEGLVMKNVRKAYYRLISSASNLNVPPDVGDYQVIDKQVLAAMRKTHDAFPYVRMMTFESGFKSIGVKYHWGERRKGLSKNRLFHLVNDGLNGLVTFTTVPLRICLYFGSLVAFASVLYAATTFVGSLVQGSMAPPGIPTLITALFFFSGVQLLFLGLIGEYIIAIYAQVRNKPLVIERERINFD